MPNPIEWKEADRTETKTIPGASARLVVRRRYAPGGIVEMTDATPDDIASALDALPAGERSMVLKAFGADPEMRAALLADCAQAKAECDAARFERDALRTELRAREWLDEQGVAVIGNPGLVLVGVPGGVLYAYASYAGAARALGWEG